MNADPKVDDVDETPEYPLPSPTDSLPRDQRPPDDEDEVGVEQVSEGDGERRSVDPVISGQDRSGKVS